MKNRHHKILQNVIYLLIWLILFVIPLFGFRDEENVRWDAVRMFWARMLPFLLLFAVNNFWLIPQLLVKRRYARYLGAVMICITAILALNQLFVRNYIFPSSSFGREKIKLAEQQSQTNKDTIVVQSIDSSQTSPAVIDKPRKPKHHFRAAQWQYWVMDAIISILLVGTNAAICLMVLSLYDRERLRSMESQTLQAELDYLKAQINPHFFMNTLNNIHALVDLDGERAKASIIELSKIMRYVLYDTNLPLVGLHKEVEFIENYVGLMRMRYSEEVRISTHYPTPLPDVQLPPLMLVTLIENAFKHGISYRHQSFIDMSIHVDTKAKMLIYTVENSYFDDVQNDKTNSGVGLTNLQKRLDLLFGSQGELTIQKSETSYRSTLKIPFQI